MRNRYRIALVSFVVALPLLMAPSGGLPSRPRFQSVGVNAAAPATGNLTASGTITGATINGTSAVQVNGVALALPGLDAATSTPVVRQVSAQFKGGDTTRSSTITLADDVTLAGLSIPAAGTYMIDGRLCFFGVTTGTQGIRMRYEFTGSAGVGTIGSYTGFVNAAVVGGGNFLALDANFISFATLTIGGAGGDCIDFRHTLNATGSGTISLQWAQNTSNANGTTLARGSSIVITRLG